MKFHCFQDFSDTVEALGTEIVTRLDRAIQNRGSASLVVSGGSTPRPLFDFLSRQDLQWEKVRITLADERCVSPSSSSNNGNLVRTALMQNKASHAQFFPLYDNEAAEYVSTDSARQIEAVESMLADNFDRYDVVVLGMGEDGHTASIFPNSAISEEALNPESVRLAMLSERAEVGYFRITQTLRRLLDCDYLALLLKGQEKLQLLENILNAANRDNYPITPFLVQNLTPAQIFASKGDQQT